ncbi:hypothetical protein [Actinoplanes sp. NPDC049681]|uniref:hypothetical protein n=1 Tax=Actinoplanes sp. NPDC049681 TaxID=3363905 RepID=UPI00379ED540
MTPSGSIAIQLALSVAMVILTAYVAGRVHQWYRHGFDRDVAYREGYNQASHTLFQLAVRNHPVGIKPAAAPSSAPGQVRAVVPLHQLPERTAIDLAAERRESPRLLHHQA